MPETIDEAADEIIEMLDLDERVRISTLPKLDIKILQMILGLYTDFACQRHYLYMVSQVFRQL